VKWNAESGNWLAELRDNWELNEVLTEQKLTQMTDTVSNFVVNNAFSVVGGIMGFLLNFIFLLFVLFFLFRDGAKLGQRTVEFIPLPEEQTRKLFRRIEEVLGGCVYGVLMVAAVQGTLGGITFWALGLKSPVTWGLVMTLLCTLPIVGAWLVWLPAAIYLAIHGDYTKAIILAVVGQFLISSIDGVLRPILVGQRAKLHELVIFFSVLGGLKYFGLLGILLGPIVMSLAYGLITVLWQAQNAQEKATLSESR
jgi:predicted PurR-regulated permease PerM